MNDGSCGGVHAVIVTYNPDPVALQQTVAALVGQVASVILVDNGSVNGATVERVGDQCRGVRVQRMPENRGVAAAQNVGIAMVRQINGSHVLLLDQDSVPTPDMVARLRASLGFQEKQGDKVAAVGPRFRVAKSGATSRFTRLGLIGVRRIDCHDAKVVRTDFLISSGMLIPVDILQEVGPMEERLFIDYVDTEWCLRARAHGFRLFGVCDAFLEHGLGEDAQRIWFGRWRVVHCHKPFRHYYIFRNCLLLAKRNYAPVRWVLFEIWHLLGLFVLFGLIGRNRTRHFGKMVRGVRDGIRGVTGELSN